MEKLRAKHTPTPWRLDDADFPLIINPDDEDSKIHTVCLFECPIREDVALDGNPLVDEQVANAQYVLTACNHFDEVVDQLKRCSDLLASISLADRSPGAAMGEARLCAHYQSGAQYELNRANAILAKIKGAEDDLE